MKRFLFMILFLMALFDVKLYAQPTAPSGYTTYYQIRKWAAGAKATADSLNANWDDIDAAIFDRIIYVDTLYFYFDSTPGKSEGDTIKLNSNWFKSLTFANGEDLILPYHTSPYSTLAPKSLGYTSGNVIIFNNIDGSRIDTVTTNNWLKEYISGNIIGSLITGANWYFYGDYLQIGTADNTDSYLNFYPGSNLNLPYFASPYTGFTEYSIAYDADGNFLYYDPVEDVIETVMTWEDYTTESSSAVSVSHTFTTSETWQAITGLSTSTEMLTVIDATNINPGGGSIQVLIDGLADYTVPAGSVSVRINKPSSSLYLASIATLTEDISTATFDFGDSLSTKNQDVGMSTIRFSTDGTKMFCSGYNNRRIYQYNLSTAYDLTTGSYSGTSYDISSYGSSCTGLAFNPDGTKMFITDGGSSNTIYSFTLGTAWNLLSLSYCCSLSVGAQDTNPYGIEFNSDGTKLFILGSSGKDILEYTLSPAYDITSASYVDAMSFSSEASGFILCFRFNNDGNKIFIYGSTNKAIFQYNLSTPYDVSTGSYSTYSLDLETFEYDPIGGMGGDVGVFDFTLNSSNSKLYLMNNATNLDIKSVVYQLSISGNIDGEASAIIKK
jgi:hypothetical protein